MRSCLPGTRPLSTAASDNFTLGQELAYSFAELYASPDQAQSALEMFERKDFQQCLLASNRKSTHAGEGVPLAGWSVTRYFFQPVLANTTFSYFDLEATRQGSFLLFMVDRKRGGEFPDELRRRLAAAMVSRASGNNN